MHFTASSPDVELTRVVQCRNLGLFQCDISAKFQKDPASVPDICLEEFTDKKRIIEKIDEHNETLSSYKRWTPILYVYEVCC